MDSRPERKGTRNRIMFAPFKSTIVSTVAAAAAASVAAQVAASFWLYFVSRAGERSWQYFNDQVYFNQIAYREGQSEGGT